MIWRAARSGTSFAMNRRRSRSRGHLSPLALVLAFALLALGCPSSGGSSDGGLGAASGTGGSGSGGGGTPPATCGTVRASRAKPVTTGTPTRLTADPKREISLLREALFTKSIVPARRPGYADPFALDTAHSPMSVRSDHSRSARAPRPPHPAQRRRSDSCRRSPRPSGPPRG